MILRTRSFADFDRSYRKGLVLGLSLAELFLILIFLLLLFSIGYSFLVSEEMNRLAAANEKYAGINEALDKAKDEITRLDEAVASGNARAERSEKERDDLADQLAEAQPLLGNLLKEGDPQNLIVSLEKKITKLQKKNAELSESLDKLSALSAEKGQYPPCWYVKEKWPSGRDRERALYIFHVRIFDDGVLVKDIEAPTAEYARQKPTLPYDREALNRKLTFDRFSAGFRPLKAEAEARKVQDYRCKFYVKVWDETSNIRSYQLALEEVVESIFFTYRVRDDPWPH